MLSQSLVLCLLVGARGWATRSQTVYGAQIHEIKAMMNGTRIFRNGAPVPTQGQLGYLWTLPEDRQDTRGLGGGITWAWNSALCDLILPKFKEDIMGFRNFVTCEDLKSSVARAFDKWSANNRYIKFVDVTKECDIANKNFGPPTADGQPGFPHGGCPLAEIWITKYVPSTGRRLGDESPTPRSWWQGNTFGLPEGVVALAGDAALTYRNRRLTQETNDGGTQTLDDAGGTESMSTAGTAVATATAHARIRSDFRYTNSQRPFYRNADGTIDYNRGVVETFAGTFTFNTEDVCWYLDADFCSMFHKLKEQMGGEANARTLIFGLTYGLMGVAICGYAILILRVALHVAGLADTMAEDDADGDDKLDCCERISAGVRAISHWNPLILTFLVILLIVPFLMASEIFEPCFSCYDFEAAALHEIGHFLGLGHLDNIPQNWAAPPNGNLAWAGPDPGQNSFQAEIASAVQAGVRPTFSCMDPWAAVEEGIPAGISPDVSATSTYPYRNAQMEARTQHNPQPCLRNDDLEALATLYPDCTITALSQSVCHMVKLNIGYFRCTYYILLPSLCALLCVVLCSTITHEFEKAEKKKLFNDKEEIERERARIEEEKAQQKAALKFQVMHAKAKHRKSQQRRGELKGQFRNSSITGRPAGLKAVATSATYEEPV